MERNKKKYIAPSLEVTEIETADVITASGIFEDVDTDNNIGIGKIEIDMDL